MKKLETVAVIGAGRLGGWLAFVSARAGYRTILEDVMPSNLRNAEERVKRLQQRGAGLGNHQGMTQGIAQNISPDDSSANTAVEFVSSVEDAVRSADLIIDCVPDELESKLEIFSLLDRMAPPHAILATPTLALSIADLASCTYRSASCVGLELDASALENEASFPRQLAVVHTSETLPEVLAAVERFWETLGVEVSFKVDRSMQRDVAS